MDSSPLSNFAMKQMCFKAGIESVEQIPHETRYVSFAITQLPPCIEHLPSSGINQRPLQEVIGGEKVLCFTHEAADLNDWTTIRISHHPHRDGYHIPTVLDPLLDPWSLVAHLVDQIHETVTSDSSTWREGFGVIGNSSHKEGLIEITLGQAGLHTRAGWCNLKYSDKGNGSEAESVILSGKSDCCSLFIGGPQFNPLHFLTVSVRPIHNDIFKVTIGCQPVDIDLNARKLEDSLAFRKSWTQ